MNVALAALGTAGLLLAPLTGAPPSSLPGSEPTASSPPFAFVENCGQWSPDVCFVLRRGDGHVVVRRDGFAIHRGTHDAPLVLRSEQAARAVEALDELPARHHFLRGPRSAWRRDVRGFSRVALRSVAEGVDLVLREGPAGQLEYDLHLAAGVDPEGFTLVVDGARELRVDPDGSLTIATGSGDVRQQAPFAFEVRSDGTRRVVATRCRVLGAHRIGFAAPDWDGTHPLVIDPGVVWASYLGDGDEDACWAIDRAANGDLLVAGSTESMSFPVGITSYQRLLGGGSDGFVARFTEDGNTLLWATYLGGTLDDVLFDVAEEPSGDVLVAGATLSNDFPVASQPIQFNHGGGWDGVLARLDPTGGTLRYGTYLGGGGDDLLFALQLDANGRPAFAGTTTSTDLPTTALALQPTLAGGQDAFVGRADLAGNGAPDLTWCTYLGGTGMEGESGRPSGALLAMDEEVNTVGLAIARNDELVVAGRTESRDFPTTPGVLQTNLAGNASSDAFCARIAADGSALRWSTYLGGADREDFGALALDPRERPVLALEGYGGGFPVSSGAFQRTHGGGTYDMILARLDAQGTTLEYATYLGGSVDDRVGAIHADLSGTITLVGASDSADFPVTRGADDTQHNVNPQFDVVLCRLRLDGRGARDLQYSTYLGRRGHDNATDLLWDEAFDATLVGFTGGNNFPVTSSAYGRTYSGNTDGFVARFQPIPTGVTPFGADTTGCPTPIAADVNSQPHVGNAQFAIVCRGGVGGAATLFFVSMRPRLVPLNVSGIDVWVDPAAVYLVLDRIADIDGYVEIDLPIPAWPGALNRTLYAQFVWPGVCFPPPLAASNGLQVTTQS